MDLLANNVVQLQAQIYATTLNSVFKTKPSKQLK